MIALVNSILPCFPMFSRLPLTKYTQSSWFLNEDAEARADFISQLARCGDSQNLSSYLKCQLIILSYSLVCHIYRNLDNCSWWQGWQSLTARVAYHSPASVKLSVRVMLSGHRVQAFQYSGNKGKIMSLKVTSATQWNIIFKAKRSVSFNPLHGPQLCGTTELFLLTVQILKWELCSGLRAILLVPDSGEMDYLETYTTRERALKPREFLGEIETIKKGEFSQI